MIGPWLTGSSSGVDALNGAPGFGAVRGLASVVLPRQDVFCGRDQVLEVVRVPVARRHRARVRTRRVDVVADRDRQQVALRCDPRLPADHRGAEAHDAAEGVADVALDRDAHVPTRIDQDPGDQVELIAGVPRLVLRRHRDAGRRAGRAGRQVASEHVTPLGFRIGRGFAADERIRDRQSAGIGGVLEEALLAVEPADVEGQTGDAHEGDQRDGEDDDDLPMGPVRDHDHDRELRSVISWRPS